MLLELMAFDRTLEEFKSRINLTAYAASCGYELLHRDSSKHSVVMKDQAGDKIVVARSANGHWIYFSVHDGSDNGTIVDFVLKRKAAGNLGRVRRELAPWLSGIDAAPAVRIPSFPELHPSSKDRQKVIRALAAMRTTDDHPHLARRGLGWDVTNDRRFSGQVFVDARGNAVFPHRDEDDICGYEVKNRGFTGFASGGEKAAWTSNACDDDGTLILAESAIDAMSFFAITRLPGCYLSTAGAWSKTTPRAILAALEDLPGECDVVLAFDHDEQGLKYVEQTKALLAGRAHAVAVELPPREGDDWNDHLRRERGIELQMPRNRLKFDRGRGN